MSEFLVGYDIRKKGTYQGLYKVLGSFEKCDFLQQSLCLIATYSTESELTARLRSALDPRDSLLVIKIK